MSKLASNLDLDNSRVHFDSQKNFLVWKLRDTMCLFQDVLVLILVYSQERVFKFTKTGMFTQILWVINIENVEDYIISVEIRVINYYWRGNTWSTTAQKLASTGQSSNSD